MKDISQLNHDVSELKRIVNFLLNSRVSHSKRIKNLHRLYVNSLSNRNYYINNRLPVRLKREQSKTNLANKAIRLFIKLDKLGIRSLNSSNKNQKRFLGFFTHQEIFKLRKLLSSRYSILSEPYKKSNYKIYKNKNIIFLTNEEINKLKKYLQQQNKIV